MGVRRVGAGVAARTGAEAGVLVALPAEVGLDQEVPVEAGLQGASLVPRLRLARVMSHAAGLGRARRIARGAAVSPRIVPMVLLVARLKGFGRRVGVSLRIVWTPADV